VKPIKPWEIESTLAEVLRDDPVGERVPLVTRHLVAENRRSRVTILVVDDDTVSQLVSDWTLRRHGYRVERAATGEEALRRHEELLPDLILVDLALPDIDGFELARRLRVRDNGDRHTPIVAVTGRVSSTDRERCREAGMDDFLTKPVELADLTRIVERWTSAGSSGAPRANPAPDAPPSAGAPPAAAPPTPEASAAKRARQAKPADTPPAPRAATPPGTVVRTTPAEPGSTGESTMMDRPNWLSGEDSAATGQSTEMKAPDATNPVRLVRPGETRETPEPPMEGFELRPRSANSEEGPPLELTDDPDSMMGAPDLAKPRPTLSSKSNPAADAPPPEKPKPTKGARAQKPSREIQIKPDNSGGKLMAEPPLDMKRLDDASMGIPAFRDALLRTFLNDLRPRLDRLDQALLNRSTDRLEMEAHGLKGMSATIGATKVAEIFSEIERLSRENMLEQAEDMIAKARLEAERLETHLKTLNMRRGRSN
jgi:CheY-like chemotaxis protein